jgi:hypothetical protein
MSREKIVQEALSFLTGQKGWESDGVWFETGLALGPKPRPPQKKA